MKILRLVPRFRRAYRRLDALADRETWTRERIEALQLERLNAVWRHAAAHVPHYRDLRHRLGLPIEFRGLEEFRALVPILPKAVHRQNPLRFLSDAPARGSWRATSGSTGTPTRYFWERAAHREVLQARYRLYASWGVDVLDRTAFLWGSHHIFEHGLAGSYGRLRQRCTDWLRGRLRLSAYHLDPTDLRTALARMRAFRPAMLYGYSTAVYLLALEALREGYSADFLKLAVLTSEIVRPEMAATVEKALGVPAIVEYGASECNLIAGKAPDRTLRVREDIVLVETPPRDDGRCDVLLTVLGNPSAPLLRYAIGDVTDRPLDLPQRGFAVLHNVSGREDDLLLSGRGRVIHSALVEMVFDQEIRNVRCFRIHQQSDGTLHVKLEPGEGFGDNDVAACRAKLHDLVEGFAVHVEVVPRIPLLTGGKLRTTTSELAAAASARTNGVAVS
jgi:phenylacetate-CoA ligase